MGDITAVSISSGDITEVFLNENDITTVSISSGDITVLTAISATINAADLSLSNNLALDVGRIASSGTSTEASRADHVHSAANLLLDGGNY